MPGWFLAARGDEDVSSPMGMEVPTCRQPHRAGGERGVNLLSSSPRGMFIA